LRTTSDSTASSNRFSCVRFPKGFLQGTIDAEDAEELQMNKIVRNIVVFALVVLVLYGLLVVVANSKSNAPTSWLDWVGSHVPAIFAIIFFVGVAERLLRRKKTKVDGENGHNETVSEAIVEVHAKVIGPKVFYYVIAGLILPLVSIFSDYSPLVRVACGALGIGFVWLAVREVVNEIKSRRGRTSVAAN
jgi:cell division protein FtsW (lipid II flippase)